MAPLCTCYLSLCLTAAQVTVEPQEVHRICIESKWEHKYVTVSMWTFSFTLASPSFTLNCGQSSLPQKRALKWMQTEQQKSWQYIYIKNTQFHPYKWNQNAFFPWWILKSANMKHETGAYSVAWQKLIHIQVCRGCKGPGMSNVLKRTRSFGQSIKLV